MPKVKKRAITAEDLYRFQLPTGCDISPDGAWVVYALSRVDQKTQKKYGNLWRVPTGGGEPAPFTHGDQSDAGPLCSPDGRWIAFLSNRKAEKQPQIYVIPTDGGEARPLTDLKGEFSDLAWSPDSRRIAFTFRKQDKEAIEREKDEEKKKLGVVSRHVTRVFYKSDGDGYLPQERRHLWTVDVATGKARQITDGEVHDEWQPNWSPDGRSLVFCSNRAPDPDLDPRAVDLFVIPARGGAMRRIPTPYGDKEYPVFSPDGKSVAYFGQVKRTGWFQPNYVWVVPADGKGRASNRTENFDVHAASFTLGDLTGVAMMPPHWSRDGKKVYFQAVEHGRTMLYSVTSAGRPFLDTIIDDPGTVGEWHLSSDHSILACCFGKIDDPAQVCVKSMDGGDLRPITRLNAELLDSLELGQLEAVRCKGRGGHDLNGWVLFPPNFRPGRKYPSILEIHGGPHAQYGFAFMHEFYYLAAQGYVVYFSNPRGSIGYGHKHAMAIENQWGGPDYDDVMAFVDHVAKRPYIDRRRMGVTGGSYGGFMTNWIIGHTKRFAAAVTQRCVSNMLSMYGSSDINWILGMELGDGTPWGDTENFWKQSPMKYIGNAKTPTLVVHSEHDHRCPIEQGEQVFVALKKLGVPTEMVRFPDESHGLSRGGRTDRRIERLKRIAGWFERYL